MAVSETLVPVQNSNCYVEGASLAHESVPWLLHRRMLICSSELASLLGLDENRSRAKILMAKYQGSPLLEHMTASELGERMMCWGKVQEEVALQEAARRCRYPLISMGRLRFKDNVQFEGTPDAVTVNAATGEWLPIEVKTRSYPNVVEAAPYLSKFDVPYKHWVQLQCYMILLKANRGVLVSHSANNGCKLYALSYHTPLVLEHILPCVAAFMDGTLSTRVYTKDRLELLRTIEHLVTNNVQEIYRF